MRCTLVHAVSANRHRHTHTLINKNLILPTTLKETKNRIKPYIFKIRDLIVAIMNQVY